MDRAGGARSNVNPSKDPVGHHTSMAAHGAGIESNPQKSAPNSALSLGAVPRTGF